MIDFDAKLHKYSKAGVIYDSVSKVIECYKNPFDGQYWALYKAIKDVMQAELGETHWSRFKRAAGGWDKVVEYYKKNGHGLHKKIAERKAQYLKAWDVKAHNARETGHAVHSWKEKAVKAKKQVSSHTPSGNTILLNVTSGQLLREQGFESNNLYAELIISNDEYRVAGTADRVEKHGDVIHISDYKTSGKIDMEAFQDAKMKYPLDSLPDCNYYHYTMQFSFYAWMLEQQGFKVGSLTLEHLLPPHYEDKDAIKYPIVYQRDKVKAMLEHYRGKGDQKQQPKSNTFNFQQQERVNPERNFNFG